jgi:hypothetical protein
MRPVIPSQRPYQEAAWTFFLTNYSMSALSPRKRCVCCGTPEIARFGNQETPPLRILIRIPIQLLEFWMGRLEYHGNSNERGGPLIGRLNNV